MDTTYHIWVFSSNAPFCRLCGVARTKLTENSRCIPPVRKEKK